jgi:hypothetical protein
MANTTTLAAPITATAPTQAERFFFDNPIPLLQLKVGYYLTDMTQPGNANLTIVPGSRKSGHAPKHADFARIGHIPGATQVCAPAGSAILFHNALALQQGLLQSPPNARPTQVFPRMLLRPARTPAGVGMTLINSQQGDS